MKSLLQTLSLALLSTLFVCSIRAQAPIISAVHINEHFGQISIFGSFGSSVPTVTVDTMHLKVLQNNDTLIRCSIPANGPGSSGDITVTDSNGTSNSKRVSAIHITVYYQYNSYTHGTNPLLTGASGAEVIYPLSFRGDLSHIRDSGYNLDPIGDSITGSFGADMSSYDTNGGTESNIVLYSSQGNVSSYPVPLADGDETHTPISAMLGYHDSSFKVSVGEVKYNGTYQRKTMATPTSQPDVETGPVSGYAAAFVLHYKVLPDFSLKLTEIDSSSNIYFDQEIGFDPKVISFLDPMPATFNPVPILAVAAVQQANEAPLAVLFPNPASDVVSIQVPYSRIEIYDALGRVVLHSESGPLNVRTLESGIYFYRMEQTDGVQSGNLIVRH